MISPVTHYLPKALLSTQLPGRITTQVRLLFAQFMRSFQQSNLATREQKKYAIEHIETLTGQETFTHKLHILAPLAKAGSAIFSHHNTTKLSLEFASQAGGILAQDYLSVFSTAKNLGQQDLSNTIQDASTERNAFDKIAEALRSVEQAERRGA